MTIYGIAFGESHLTVASDGAATYADGDAPKGYPKHVQVPTTKLAQVPGTSLLRGLVGEFSNLRHVDKWLAEQTVTTWEALADGVGPIVADLNVAALARAHRMKKKKEDVQRSSLILAGYLDGRLDAVLVAENGDTLILTLGGHRWIFVGVMGLSASVAWQAATALSPGLSLSDPETMRTLFNSLCLTVPELGPPVDVWKVTKETGPKQLTPPQQTQVLGD